MDDKEKTVKVRINVYDIVGQCLGKYEVVGYQGICVTVIPKEVRDCGIGTDVSIAMDMIKLSNAVSYWHREEGNQKYGYKDA